MENKMGFLTSILLFGMCVVPMIFDIFDGSVKSNKAMNVATELNQMLSAEGGITPRVDNVIKNLESRGYVVEMQTESGARPTGIQPAGTTIKFQVDLDGYITKGDVTVNKRS
ncbi:hypothetical protein [Rummeliibacillus pycnus]|uniref:hypothetical protein n=1 Tax=Rummeliibacillus pycnus TaxID=101070 RepID=UPI003D2720A6